MSGGLRLNMPTAGMRSKSWESRSAGSADGADGGGEADRGVERALGSPGGEIGGMTGCLPEG